MSTYCGHARPPAFRIFGRSEPGLGLVWGMDERLAENIAKKKPGPLVGLADVTAAWSRLSDTDRTMFIAAVLRDAMTKPASQKELMFWDQPFGELAGVSGR